MNVVKRVISPLLKVGSLLLLLKFALAFFQFGAFLFKGGDLAQAGGWLGVFFVQKIEGGQITLFDVFLLSTSVSIVTFGLTVFGIFRVLWGLAKAEDWLALATTITFIVAIIATDFGQSLPLLDGVSTWPARVSTQTFAGFGGKIGVWLARPFSFVGQLVIKAVGFVLTVLIAISAFGLMCWPILLLIGVAIYFWVKERKKKEAVKGVEAADVAHVSSPAVLRWVLIVAVVSLLLLVVVTFINWGVWDAFLALVGGGVMLSVLFLIVSLLGKKEKATGAEKETEDNSD